MTQTTFDLFGEPIAAATAFRRDGRERKIGYAARPGTGPKGQRCNTCSHCILLTYSTAPARKCEIMVRHWTPSSATDIKHNAPACSEWARKPFAKIHH